MPSRFARTLWSAIICTLLSAGVASAQALPPLASLQVRYSTLKATVKPDGDLKQQIAEIDKALAAALRAGHLGEARRLVAKGTVLLTRREWTDALDFTYSLALRTDRVFVDPARPYSIRLEQIYTPSIELASTLTAHVRLRQPPRSGAGAGGAAGLTAGQQPGVIEKEMGTFGGVPRDLAESPFPIDLDLTGVPDGRHVVEVELSAGDRPLGAATLRIEVRKSLDARLAKLQAGANALTTETGKSVKPDILYPADYVRKVNRGFIEIGSFDAEREIAAAEAALVAAKAGKDPYAKQKGDMRRHYLLTEAGEIMSFRLFVPSTYDGKSALPLIIALHGLGVTEDSMFDAYGKRIPALAEAHGYLVAAPLGYRIDGGYGSPTLSQQDPAQRRKRELSEADVMSVLEFVEKHYRVDPDRVYLMGHSMGAIGTWYLGAKYAGRWAALAPFSGIGVPATVDQMKQIPEFVVHGDADTTVPVVASRLMVTELKRLGVEHRYVEVPGGTHFDVVEPNLAAAFDFFDAHSRAKAKGGGGH
jgi:poly(3-hydroxybutyrate) depolymerase